MKVQVQRPRWKNFVVSLTTPKWPVIDYEEQAEKERKERIRTLFGE